MNRSNYKNLEELIKTFLMNSPFEFKAQTKDDLKRPHKLRPDLDFITYTNYLFSKKQTKTKWEAAKSSKEELQIKLNECVSNQNFEKAIKLRDQIKNLEKNDSKTNQLKKELDLAIQEQNFEKAIEIRDKIKNIN